ncbi:MAG: hypothetical protein JWQ48_3723, partial [Conexibacter sp.]|nr:hypothetical protein [Conexibacter sp.]
APGTPAGAGGARDGAARTRAQFSLRLLRLRLPKGAHPLVRVRVTCPRTATTTCRGWLTLRAQLAPGAALATVGHARFAVARGHSTVVALRLSSALVQPLAADGAVRGDAILSTRDGLGRLRRATLRLTLFPPR